MSFRSQTLLIRADASERIGGGHVMRCLALAAQWRAGGGRIVFACTTLPEALKQRLEADGMEVEMLPLEEEPSEIERVLTLAGQLEAQAVVADLYRISANYLGNLATLGRKILCVDDNAELPIYPVDFILNQNAHAKESDYAGSSARLLLGPSYALLREEFSPFSHWIRDAAQAPRRVLLSMGGGNQIPVMLDLLRRLRDGLEGLTISVAMAREFENAQAVRDELTRLHLKGNLLVAPKNMAEQLAEHDLLISSGGSSVWEALYMQMPALFVAIAENQVNSCRALRDVIPHPVFLSPEEVEPESLRGLMESAEKRCTLAREGRRVVDGRGAQRVVEALAG